MSPRSRSPWGLLAGASLVSVSLGAYELAPASVTPLIRESLGVAPSAAGLLVGVMFGTAVVASLPSGLVLDRTNSRWAIAVAVVALVLAGGWGWLAALEGAYPSLLASRILGGIAYTVIWNAGIDVVGRTFDAETQATAVTIFTASGPIGFAIGQGGAPIVAARMGWEAIFPVFSAPALLGLALFWPTSQGTGRASGGDVPTLADFGAVVTSLQVWTVGGLGFLAYVVYLFINSWAPSYLAEELALSLGLSGLLVALFPAVGVVGRVSGGILSDRVFGGRRRPVILLAFLVAAPVTTGFTLLRPVPLVIGGLLVVGLAIQLCLGLSFAYVRELVEPSVAATAVAFLTSVGLAGAFISPIVGGAVIDAAGYDAAFGLVGSLGFLGLLLAWYAPEAA